MKRKIRFLIAMLLVLSLTLVGLTSCSDLGGESGGESEDESGGEQPDGSGNEQPGGNGNEQPGGSSDEQPGNVEGGIGDGVYWEKAPIIVQIAKGSDSKTYIAGADKYYVGETNENPDIIDVAVKNRNEAAARYANVEVTYKYLPDNSSNDWGSCTLMYGSQFYIPGQTPDIASGFVYDITLCALKNQVANLRSNSSYSESTYGNGQNYFGFNEDNYDGDDYFYEYMKSITLSDDKMYVLASNYTLDFIRAMSVIPVNVKLMNSISYDLLPKTDGITKEDGETNVEYFYKQVYAGKWSYELLAAYSKAVWSGEENAYSNLSDVLGFVVSTGGHTANTLFFNHSIQILKKTPIYDIDEINDKHLVDCVCGDYLVKIPFTNDDFLAYTEHLYNTLSEFGKNGIITVSQGASKQISEKFANDEVLFGGIASLYTLESDNYQAAHDGFVIAPIPIYMDGDNYNTTVNINARAIALCNKTTSFEQSALYLDYLSKNSEDIVNEYFKEYFINDENNEDLNAEALKLIVSKATLDRNQLFYTIICSYSYGYDKTPLHHYYSMTKYQPLMFPDFEGFAATVESKQSLKLLIRRWNEPGYGL